MSYTEFCTVMREHIAKIDGKAVLLTANEKEQRRHGFALLVIDYNKFFGQTESVILKDCGLA